MIVVGRETFKKTITDPETIEKISKENQKLINLFIKSLEFIRDFYFYKPIKFKIKFYLNYIF